MLNKKLLLAVALLLTPLFAGNDDDTQLDSLLLELNAVKQLYEIKMNELEESSQERWALRQAAIIEKEQNRELIEDNEQAMERLYSEISRIREEKLAREGIFITEDAKLEEESSYWTRLAAITLAKKDAATDNFEEQFPLGLEDKLAAYSSVDQQFPGDKYPAKSFSALVDVRIDELAQSMKSGVASETVVLRDNLPIELNILRIGDAVAMAHKDSSAYYLNYYGNGVVNPYRWEAVTDPQFASATAEAITSVLGSDTEFAIFPVDIMQNQQSQDMFSGNKLSKFEELKETLNAGGFVVYPLGILLLVATLLVINRLVVYQMKHRASARFIKKTITLLEKNELDDAQKLGEKTSGTLPAILCSSLKHSEFSRERAEQNVRELLVTEVPKLDKHLETIAVLAAAAPLLGLLGTVTGMIAMFESITKFGTGDPTLLAGGISEALVTTQLGLSIAIPVLLTHTHLNNKRNHIQGDLEMYAMMILNRLWPSE